MRGVGGDFDGGFDRCGAAWRRSGRRGLVHEQFRHVAEHNERIPCLQHRNRGQQRVADEGRDGEQRAVARGRAGRWIAAGNRA